MSNNAQIVRIKRGKHVFEAATNEGTVLKYRDGKLGWSQVPLVEVVFTSFQKGNKANEKDLHEAFGTSDVNAVLKEIVEKGDLQVSSAERKEAVDKKLKEILNYIHKNYLDPKTKLPHPMVRLEQAFENSKIRIDPDASEVKQAEVLMKSLQGKLLFSKAEIEGELTVAKSYMGSCSNIVHSMTEVKREEYSASGVVWYIGISPGDFDIFVEKLNKITKGDYSFKLSGASSSLQSQPEEEDIPNSKSGKKGGRGGKKSSQGKPATAPVKKRQ